MEFMHAVDPHHFVRSMARSMVVFVMMHFGLALGGKGYGSGSGTGSGSESSSDDGLPYKRMLRRSSGFFVVRAPHFLNSK